MLVWFHNQVLWKKTYLERKLPLAMVWQEQIKKKKSYVQQYFDIRNLTTVCIAKFSKSSYFASINNAICSSINALKRINKCHQ